MKTAAVLPRTYPRPSTGPSAATRAYAYLFVAGAACLVYLWAAANALGLSAGGSWAGAGGSVWSGPWRWPIFFAAALIASALISHIWRGRLLLCLNMAGVTLLVTSILFFGEAQIAMLGLLVMAASSGIAGVRLVHLIVPRNSVTGLERLLLGLFLGLGVLAVLGALLAFAGLLHTPFVAAILTILALPALCRLPTAFRRTVNSLRSSWRPAALAWIRAASQSHAHLQWPALGLAALSVSFCGPLLWAFAPAVHWDALVYHLPTPLTYAQLGAAVPLSDNRATYLATQVHALYAIAYVLGGQPLPALLHFTFGLLTTGLVFCLARRLAGSLPAWISAVVFASLPLVGWEAGSAYIDLFATAYVFAAMFVLLRWASDEHDGWLLLGGVFGGMAVATKLNTAIFLVGAGLVVCAQVSLWRRRPWRALQSMLTFGVPAALVPLPWAIRNWAWTENPLYPWSMLGLKSPTLAEFENHWESVGVGRGLHDFLLLPYDLVVHGPSFEPLGHGALGVVPLLALTTVFTGRALPNFARVPMALLIVPSLGLWFWTVQSSRYLLPLLPLLTVVSLVGAADVARLILRRRVGKSVQVAGLGLLGVYLVAALSVQTLWDFYIPEAFPYRVALGLETRDQFLARALRVFPALTYLNQQSQPSPGARDGVGTARSISDGPRVLGAAAHVRLYLDLPLDDVVYTPGLESLLKLPPDRELAVALSTQGYQYLLIDWRLIADQPWWQGLPYINRAFLDRFSTPAFTANEITVYRLHAEAAPRPGGSITLTAAGAASYLALLGALGATLWLLSLRPAQNAAGNGRPAPAGAPFAIFRRGEWAHAPALLLTATRLQYAFHPELQAVRARLLAPSAMRLDVALAGALSLVSFVLYARTVAPTVYSLDAAEFAIASYTWGIPHATGYPLFVLLGRLFMVALPMGDPAYRIVIMTALFAALVPGALYFVLRELRLHRAPSVLASAMFAVSYYQWASAVVTKEHSLRDWLLALTLWALLRWRHTDQFGWLAGAAGLAALSLTNHMSSGLYAPLYAVAVLARRQLRPVHIFVLASVVAVAQIPYLYLPLAYLARPAFNIAGQFDANGTFHPVNLASLDGMFWMLSARQFGSQMFATPLQQIPAQFIEMLHWFWATYAGVGIVLGVAGGRALYMRNRWFFWLLVSMAAAHMAFFVPYAVPDRDAMFVPLYMLWAVPLGFGLSSAVALLGDSDLRRLVYFATGLFVVIVGIINYPLVDLSEDRRPREWATAFLGHLPPNTVVLARWVTAGPLQYLILVEDARPDVVVIDRFLISEADMLAFIQRNASERPIVVDGLDLLPAGKLDPSIVPRQLPGRTEFLLDRTGAIGLSGFILERQDAGPRVDQASRDEHPNEEPHPDTPGQRANRPAGRP